MHIACENKEGKTMKKTISYDKLWKLLIDKKWNRTKLKDESEISTASLAKLGKNANITTDGSRYPDERIDCQRKRQEDTGCYC